MGLIRRRREERPSFCEQKEAKKLYLLRALARSCQRPRSTKVFCFPRRGAFFSKKKRFLFNSEYRFPS
jgi:hypothetical protein